MVIPEGYKQTEIGVIPEDWEIATIGDIANFQGGSQPDIKYFSSQQREDRIRLVQIRDYKTNKYITYIPISLAKRFCNKDDIMIGRYGPPIFQILRGIDGAYNVALIKATPKNIHREFLYYTLKDEKLFEYIELLSRRSSGQTGVDLDGLRNYYIGLPSLEEQEYIANALSNVDDMILSIEKLIDKKKAVKQGAMQELLTGKKRLPGFTEEWKGYCVGKMGSFYNGLSGKSKKDFNCGNAHFITFLNILSNVKIDISILASVNVKENESQNAVKKGDLFFNTSSETPEEVGMCAVLDEDLNNTFLNSFCFGFRLNNDDHNPLFLSYYFNSTIGRKIMGVLAQGATRYNLSKNNFAETVLKLPPKDEQTAIASILSDMDNEISALEQKLKKAHQLKQGMMQQLLTGKIRLL